MGYTLKMSSIDLQSALLKYSLNVLQVTNKQGIMASAEFRNSIFLKKGYKPTI